MLIWKHGSSVIGSVAVLFGMLVCAETNAGAQSTPFYQGKTIRLVVGSPPGGFYDRAARLLARHMGKQIPGNPEIIVQNMPGAGSLVATNYIYSVAKGDGLTVGMPLSYIYLDQLTGKPEVKFDVRKLGWIGALDKTPAILYMRADTPYRTIEDIAKAKEPPKCGASGTSSASNILVRALEEALGVKMTMILGYPGGSEIDLAVEKGEIVCAGMTLYAHFGREPFGTWHQKGFDRHLVQTGRKRDPRAAEVPTLYELMDKYKTSGTSRRVIQVLFAGDEYGHPMMAPPDTPVERLKLLRNAYTKALKDPELLADAKKSKMELDPSTGEEQEAMMKDVINQPAEVIQKVKKLLAQ
ncbi:MAG: Bug family tripartite tricarboxylate transporter substrate binding protein [Candidatus Binatia bacterium]